MEFWVRDSEEFRSWEDGKMLGKLFRKVEAPPVQRPSLACVDTRLFVIEPCQKPKDCRTKGLRSGSEATAALEERAGSLAAAGVRRQAVFHAANRIPVKKN